VFTQTYDNETAGVHTFRPGDSSEESSFHQNFDTQLTMSAWIKMDGNTSTYSRIVEMGDADGQYDRDSSAIAFGADGSSHGDSNTLRAWTNDASEEEGGRTPEVRFDMSPYVGDGQMHLVTYTFDNNYAKLYVDGQEVDSVEITDPIASIDNPDVINIGGYDGGDHHTFNGDIDGVGVYNQALSPEQIQAVYESGNGGSISTDTPVEETVVFSDNFDDGNADGWHEISFNNLNTGHWHVSDGSIGEKSNAARGIIAHDMGDKASMNEYKISVDVNANTGDTYNNDVGITFGYQDSNNYYTVEWTDYSTNYEDSLSNTYQDFNLVKVEDGVKTVLDTIDHTYLGDKFNLSVDVSNDKGIVVSVNGEEKLSAATEHPEINTFGLNTGDNDKGVSYDNVEVVAPEAGHHHQGGAGDDVFVRGEEFFSEENGSEHHEHHHGHHGHHHHHDHNDDGHDEQHDHDTHHGVDGGAGFDTLVASDNNMNIDLSVIDDKASNIEAINLNDGENQLSNIKLEDVINLTDDDNILRIEGGESDTVSLNTTGENAEWTLGDFKTTDELTGQTYDVYTNDDDTVTLEISTEIHVDES
jgi:hypothetical protein